MKKAWRFLGFFVLSLGFITTFLVYAHAQGHPEGMVWIKGGNITLTISTASLNPEEDFQFDEVTNTSCKLFWNLGTIPSRKITVQTDVDSPKFTLKVLAIDLSENSGKAAGEVTLSTTAQNFVIDIPWWPGKWLPWGCCTLKYTASATLEQGTGEDIHTIIYTIIKT